MIQVDPYWLYVTTFMIIALSVITYLIVRSSKEYPPEKVEADAHEFAGVIKDGHGEITLFLWATYAGLVVWALAYLVQHWNEFLELGY
jgi:hypothetical protein